MKRYSGVVYSVATTLHIKN